MNKQQQKKNLIKRIKTLCQNDSSMQITNHWWSKFNYTSPKNDNFGFSFTAFIEYSIHKEKVLF